MEMMVKHIFEIILMNISIKLELKKCVYKNASAKFHLIKNNIIDGNKLKVRRTGYIYDYGSSNKYTL